MKKFNKTLLTTIAIGLLSYCCTNEESLAPEADYAPSGLIEDARNWHYTQTHDPGLFSGRLSNDQKLILTPRFSEAKLKRLENGRKLLYTPAMDFDLENKEMAFLRGFVFSVRDNKIATGRIVEFYGSRAFISTRKTELLAKYLEGDLGDFTGSIISYDVNYRYVHGQVFENGRRTAAMPKLGYKVHHQNGQSSGGRTLDGQWYDAYLVQYWSDGSETWSYLYSYCIGCGGGGGENPGGGSTGDNGSGAAPVDADYVYNEVTDPCISQQVQNALSTDMVNGISTLIREKFNINNSYNITFTQSTTLATTEDGNTIAEGGLEVSRLDVDITLNANTLPGASQEYIMATVYHELLHAALMYNGVSSSQQHEDMASGYVVMLTNALLENFPNLSPQDATRLSWGGLQETAAYNNLSSAEKTAISNVNSNHKNNNSGTSCN